jgi:hypothetical protein
MFTIIAASVLLVALTTVIHYEVLRALNAGLPSIRIPGRFKLLVVMFATFAAHTVEMGIYGVALYIFVMHFGLGSFAGPTNLSLTHCLYFSAETYTSLGFGDITPVGPIRLLAGAEALNGLLLIGWSASYAYIAMERFWDSGRQ